MKINHTTAMIAVTILSVLHTASAQSLSEPNELARARDVFCKQIEQAKTIYRKRLSVIGASYERQNKQKAVDAVRKEIQALDAMTYNGARPSAEEHITVITRHRKTPLTVSALRKESEVSDVFIEAGRFDPEWKGKENVLHIHPISQLSPCIVDFTHITLP
ncbi:MAG: hypothetical protein PHG65_12015, partial [Kiritimatiellae bacterium]|nr:hypothetical protein [Kiritimatiellia bacterium]